MKDPLSKLIDTVRERLRLRKSRDAKSVLFFPRWCVEAILAKILNLLLKINLQKKKKPPPFT